MTGAVITVLFSVTFGKSFANPKLSNNMETRGGVEACKKARPWQLSASILLNIQDKTF